MYHQENTFNSPDFAFQNRNKSISPNMYQGYNRMSPRTSPYQRSPMYNNFQPQFHPRCSSPIFSRSRGSNRSFNNSPYGSDRWSTQANASYSSESSSSSYFGDVSQMSPVNSPYRNNRSPFPYKNNQFQGKQSFHRKDSNESNPGHTNDIKLYIDKSMLEDPWKELMAEMEKKTSN